MAMRVIVIGATGFIGAYLVDALLATGHEPVPAGRSEQASAYFKSRGLKMIELDITCAESFSSLPTHGIDAVVNLAAIIPAANKSLNVQKFLAVNTLGAWNSMHFCLAHEVPIHILTTSHFAVEGHWGCWDSARRRIDESMGVNFLYTGGHAAYIVTKVAAEEYARHFREEFGLRSIVFRLSGVRGFGRYESGFEFFVRQAQEGNNIEVFGDPSKVWDNIYVKDVARAIILGLEQSSVNDLYMLSSGIPLTLLQEVNAIADVFSPPDRRISVIARPDKSGGINKSYVYDIGRFVRDAGFRPEFPLNVQATLEDYAAEVDRGTYRWLKETKEGRL